MCFGRSQFCCLLLLPAVTRLIYELCNKPVDIDFYQHFLYTLQNARDNFYRASLDFIFMPYEAWMNASAILQTNWRVFISKRRLLEWNPYGASVRANPLPYLPLMLLCGLHHFFLLYWAYICGMFNHQKKLQSFLVLLILGVVSTWRGQSVNRGAR